MKGTVENASSTDSEKLSRVQVRMLVVQTVRQ
jgi:hypothetical protein